MLIYYINATFSDMFSMWVHNAIIWPWFTVQLPISGEAWKMGSGIIQARLGPNFLSGQMSIQRNYKVGLLHFHRLRLARSYIDGETKPVFWLYVHIRIILDTLGEAGLDITAGPTVLWDQIMEELLPWSCICVAVVPQMMRQSRVSDRS